MKKQKLMTVDITPTWLGLLPTLLVLVKDSKPSNQKAGYDELIKMATAADRYNELVNKGKK